MSTAILNIADPHYSDKKPRSRKDDYQETQLRKTKDLLTLAQKLTWEGKPLPAAAVTISGDICHQPRGELISRRLDIRLIKTYADSPCPVLAILGNHDKDRDRIESLETHPLGTLVASKIMTLVHWPDYVIVGEDPLVIVTGRQYSIDGPGSWLDYLRETQQLVTLKNQVSQDRGKAVYAFVMTHCNWGPNDGALRGDPIVGHSRVLGTGVDVMCYGHPHTDDGIVELEDNGRLVRIVGQGAFTRGTLAEHDVTRQPKIALAVFHSDKDHEVLTVPIPHEPVDKVFDLATHTKVRQQKDAEERFIKALASLDAQSNSPEEVIAAAADRTPARIVARAQQYYTAAEAEVGV